MTAPMIFALSALSLICIVNYLYSRDKRYPPFILSLLWLILLSLYALDPGKFGLPELGGVTCLAIAGSIALFSVSGVFLVSTIRCLPRPGSPTRTATAASSRRRQIRRALFGISVILFPFFLLKSLQLSRESGIDNFFIGLRSVLTTPGGEGYGFIGNASILSFFTTFISAIETDGRREEKIMFGISFLLSAAYGVLYTGRTVIWMLLITLLFIGSSRDVLKFRHVLYCAIGLFIAFFSGALIFAKGIDLSESYRDNVSLLANTILVYMLGPIAAFDNLVKLDMEYGFGENIFSWVVNLESRFRGGRFISPIQDYVYIPFPTNVYTGFRPLYADFKILGVYLGFLVIGLVVNYFYVRATKSAKPLYIYLYSITMFTIVLNPFDDQIFAPLVSILKYIFLGCIYFSMERLFAGRNGSAEHGP